MVVCGGVVCVLGVVGNNVDIGCVDAHRVSVFRFRNPNCNWSGSWVCLNCPCRMRQLRSTAE